ncbi:hypothetical protein GS982_20475 [Rhodococcus hoagii]|nr:hypothetical protein [Prescottella equi]NKZ84571.1 hypothetical protein [Prescottella equi]
MHEGTRPTPTEFEATNSRGLFANLDRATSTKCAYEASGYIARARVVGTEIEVKVTDGEGNQLMHVLWPYRGQPYAYARTLDAMLRHWA